MPTHDLPDSHVRLVFAVMLHRAGSMTDEELRSEAVVAFGPETGALIADHVLAARSAPA